MKFDTPRVRLSASVLILAALAMVAGCQSRDNAGGVLNLGGGQPQRSGERITAEEVRAHCPQVRLPGAQAVLSRYERNGDGDPAKLQQQISVMDVTRTCNFSAGQMGITVALAGRIVPGQAGLGGGSVTVPVKIEVIEVSGQVLYSQVHQYPVQTSTGGGATQFIFTDPNIVIPQLSTPTVRIFAGLDVPAPKEPRI